MPRPGTDVLIVDDAVPSGAILDTGQAFFAGTSERGPTDRALKVKSLKDYGSKYGGRSGGSLMYDSVGAYFAEGGGTLYCSRITGGDAVAATGAFGSLTVNAASPGAWGNDLTVTAEAPATLSEQLRADLLAAGDPIVAVVALDDINMERSPVCATADDLVAWATNSSLLVRFVKGADNLVPAAGTAAALTTGADGTAALTQDNIDAALARFEYALGPGQVACPGLTSDIAHTALCGHVDAMRRCALLDLPDSSDPTVLGASVAVLQAPVAGVRFCAAFAPWAEYPGSVSPAIVTIPYSGIQAGLIARADAAGNPNDPAAGVNGISRYAVGLSQAFTDDQREALNEAGVCMAKDVRGQIETYGYRTAAGPDDTLWLWFGNSRVIMAIAYQCDAIAENYVLRQIDGRRQLFAKLETQLRGVLLTYYNAGALYGETPAEAFSVDTGETVNTIETIAAGEIHAVIRVRCSPAGEWVVIEIVKVPVERALAA